MYWFTHIGVTLEMNNWDAYSPGKLDQHLEPFYEKGIKDKTLTRSEAKELLEALWIQFNNQAGAAQGGDYFKRERDLHGFL